MRFLYLVTCLLLSPVAFADQNDERLPQLFERLIDATDPHEGQSITGQIWEIWYQVAEPKAHELMSRGVTQMRHRQYDAALQSFNELVELTPKFAEGWNRRATLYYLMGDYAASVDDIKRTLSLEPRHFGALSGLGLIYIQQEEWNQAIAAFKRALDVNPHMPGPRQNIQMIEEHIRGSTI